MSPWTWLGIPQEASEAEVRRAYAQTLRRHRPDEDPQGFQTTHEAYRIALQWARQRAAWAAEAEATPDADSDDSDALRVSEAPAGPAPLPASAPEAQAASPTASPVMEDPAEPAPNPVTPPAQMHIDRPIEPPELPPEDPALDDADGMPDSRFATQRPPLFEFDAPTLRRFLQDPASAIDAAELQGELGAALAGLPPENHETLAYRIAAVVEASAQPPAPGVVSVLADALGWDARFLRHRDSRIPELLAADEVCAAIRARLQDPAPANRLLRALAQPPRYWHPRSWPLWWSTRAAYHEVLRIHAEGGASALQLLHPAAVQLTRDLADRGQIGRHRLTRWLAVALAVTLCSVVLLGLQGRDLGAVSGTALGLGAWTLAAAYVRARVLQVYALPLEPARPLWLLALLLGLLLLAGSTPWFTPIFWLVGIATATLIGSARLWPGLLAVGASLMLPAAIHPLISPLPEVWLIANLVVVSGCVLAIDHVRAHRSGRHLAEVATEQQPLYWLGGAIFMLLAVVGAISEEARQPLPVRPTHVA